MRLYRQFPINPDVIVPRHRKLAVVQRLSRRISDETFIGARPDSGSRLKF
jgi:hypothetical protein